MVCPPYKEGLTHSPYTLPKYVFLDLLTLAKLP